jgi:hypothetical protein
MFGVQHAGGLGVLGGVQVMPVGGVGVMGGNFCLGVLVMFGGLTVMMGSLLVVAGGLFVMVSNLIGVRHRAFS